MHRSFEMTLADILMIKGEIEAGRILAYLHEWYVKSLILMASLSIHLAVVGYELVYHKPAFPSNSDFQNTKKVMSGNSVMRFTALSAFFSRLPTTRLILILHFTVVLHLVVGFPIPIALATLSLLVFSITIITFFIHFFIFGNVQ